MDRREALKKMMAGGAVIAGASMVSSSPVFAAGSVGSGQPVVPGMTTPPPPGAIANDKRSNTWLFTAPTGTCSSGAAPQVMSYATVGPMSPNLNVMMTPFGGYAPGNTATLTVIGLWPGNSPFRLGDWFEVTWHVQYKCIVSGVVTGCKMVDYTYRYVNRANGNPNWQPHPGYPVAVSSQSCT